MVASAYSCLTLSDSWAASRAEKSCSDQPLARARCRRNSRGASTKTIVSHRRSQPAFNNTGASITTVRTPDCLQFSISVSSRRPILGWVSRSSSANSRGPPGGAANTIRAKAARSTRPSGAKMAAPHRCRAACSTSGSRSTSWPALSASSQCAPNWRNWLATRLFPLAIPPKIPTIRTRCALGEPPGGGLVLRRIRSPPVCAGDLRPAVLRYVSAQLSPSSMSTPNGASRPPPTCCISAETRQVRGSISEGHTSNTSSS